MGCGRERSWRSCEIEEAYVQLNNNNNNNIVQQWDTQVFKICIAVYGRVPRSECVLADSESTSNTNKCK